MLGLHLTPTSFDDLSELQYRVSLPAQNGQDRYPFVHVAFSGTYADRDDAVFILAIMAAVQTAWFSPTLIIDLTAFSYTSGDEMEWIVAVHFRGAEMDRQFGNARLDRARNGYPLTSFCALRFEGLRSGGVSKHL